MSPRGGCSHSSRKEVIQIGIKSKTKSKTCMKLHGHDETEIAFKLNKKSGLLSRVMRLDKQTCLCRIPLNSSSFSSMYLWGVVMAVLHRT